jgi:hypothetical protein
VFWNGISGSRKRGENMEDDAGIGMPKTQRTDANVGRV